MRRFATPTTVLVFLTLLLWFASTITPATSSYLPDYQSCGETYYCQWLRQAQGVLDKPFQWTPNDDIHYHPDLNLITFSLHNTKPLPTPSHTATSSYQHDPFEFTGAHNSDPPVLEPDPGLLPLQVGVWITQDGIMRFKVIENIEIIRSRGFRWHPHDVIQHQYATPAPANVTIYQLDAHEGSTVHSLCLRQHDDEYCVVIELLKETGIATPSPRDIETSGYDNDENGSNNDEPDSPSNFPFSKTSVNFDPSKFTITHTFNGKAVTILNALSMFDYQQRYQRSKLHSQVGPLPTAERLTPDFRQFPHQSISLDVVMPFATGLHGLPEHSGSYRLPLTSPNRFFRAPLNPTNLRQLSKSCLRHLSRISMDSMHKALPASCVPGYDSDYSGLTRGEVDLKNFKKMNRLPQRDPFKLYALDIGIYDHYDSGSAMYGGIPFVLGKSHSTQTTQKFTARHDSHSLKAEYDTEHDRVTPCSGIFINSISELYMDVSQTSLLTKSSANGPNGYINSNKYLHPNAPTMYWMMETGDLDVFSFAGHHCNEVHRQYHTITFRPILLPHFSLGFHQSHWNYLSDGKSMTVLYHSDSVDTPIDVLWLDIEHTNNKQYLTFDPQAFPQPLSTQLAFAETGRSTVVIIDPHLSSELRESASVLKGDKSSSEPRLYALAQESINKRYTLMQLNNTQTPRALDPVTATCWPGVSVWSDYLQEMVREWWSERIYKAMCPGIDIDTILNNPLESELLYHCLSQETKERFFVASGTTAERIANDPTALLEFKRQFLSQGNTEDGEDEDVSSQGSGEATDSRKRLNFQRDPTVIHDLEHVYAPYTHIWNDMNEPAVFKMEDEFSSRDAPQRTMPKDTIHLQLLHPRPKEEIEKDLVAVLEQSSFVARIRGDDDQPKLDPETIHKVSQFGSLLYHTIVHDNTELCPAVLKVRAGEETINDGTPTECWLQHQAVHNFYGISYHVSTMHGAAKARQSVISANPKFTADPSVTPTSTGHMQPSQRQFTLTRSFYSGSHSVGSMWTGDNSALFSHLAAQVNMGLSLSSAGYSATGADLGGFAVEDTHPENLCELNIRSFHAGLLHALFRSHAIKEAAFKEPFRFIMDNVGEGTESEDSSEAKWFKLQCGQQLRLLSKQRVRLVPQLFTGYTSNHLTGQQVLNGVDTLTPEKSRVDGYDGYLSNGLFILTPFDEPTVEDKFLSRQLITRPLTQYTWESLTKEQFFQTKSGEFRKWLTRFGLTAHLPSSTTASNSHSNRLEIIPFYDLNTGTRFRSSLIGLTSTLTGSNSIDLHMVLLNILPITTFSTFVDPKAPIYPISTPIFTVPSSIIYTYQSTGRSLHSSKSRGLVATVTMNKPLPLVTPVNGALPLANGEEYNRFDKTSFIPIYASGFIYLDINNTDHVVMNPNFFAATDRAALSQSAIKSEQDKLLLYPGSRSMIIGLDQHFASSAQSLSQFPFAMVTYPIINPPTRSPLLDDAISYIPHNPFGCTYPGEFTNQCFMSLSTRKQPLQPLQSPTPSCQLNDPLNPHLCVNIRHGSYTPYELLPKESETIGLDLRKISLFNILQTITNSGSTVATLPKYAFTLIFDQNPGNAHQGHPIFVASKQIYGTVIAEINQKLDSFCPNLTSYPQGLPSTAIYTPSMCTIEIGTIVNNLEACQKGARLFKECHLLQKVQISPLLVESNISFKNTHYQSTKKAPTRYFNEVTKGGDVINSILHYSFSQLKSSLTPSPSDMSSTVVGDNYSLEHMAQYLRETFFGSTFHTQQLARQPTLQVPIDSWPLGESVASHLDDQSSILRSQHDLFKNSKDAQQVKEVPKKKRNQPNPSSGVKTSTVYHFKVNGFDANFEFQPRNDDTINPQSFSLSQQMSYVYDGGNDGLAIDINIVFNVEHNVLKYTITNFI